MNNLPLSNSLKRGVTMIEIVIVVVVLAILALVVLPRITGITAGATATSVAHNKKIVNNLLEGFSSAGGVIAAATGSTGSTSVNGAVNSSTATTLVASLGAGVFAGGYEYRLASVPTDLSLWTVTAAMRID